MEAVSRQDWCASWEPAVQGRASAAASMRRRAGGCTLRLFGGCAGCGKATTSLQLHTDCQQRRSKRREAAPAGKQHTHQEPQVVCLLGDAPEGGAGRRLVGFAALLAAAASAAGLAAVAGFLLILAARSQAAASAGWLAARWAQCCRLHSRWDNCFGLVTCSATWAAQQGSRDLPAAMTLPCKNNRAHSSKISRALTKSHLQTWHYAAPPPPQGAVQFGGPAV